MSRLRPKPPESVPFDGPTVTFWQRRHAVLRIHSRCGRPTEGYEVKDPGEGSIDCGRCIIALRRQEQHVHFLRARHEAIAELREATGPGAAPRVALQHPGVGKGASA